MLNLQLSSDESEILRDVLRHTINELDVEIGRTDTHDFKMMLERRANVLKRLLYRVEQPSSISEAA